jgi:hypothetical protein
LAIYWACFEKDSGYMSVKLSVLIFSHFTEAGSVPIVKYWDRDTCGIKNSRSSKINRDLIFTNGELFLDVEIIFIDML